MTENPFIIDRTEHDDGSITYEIFDIRPDSYRLICFCPEDEECRGQAKIDADMIVTALNMIFGSRKFQSAKLRVMR